MKFIVFEGLDGAGKSTLMKLVQDHLLGRRQPCEFVRDPGSTPVGEKLRQIILDPNEKPVARAEVLMYQAARTQLVHEVIRPALQNRKWVLSDRFYSSTIAFQCVARGLPRKDIDWLNRFACEDIQPDMVIFIDIPVQESLRRLNQRVQMTGTQQDRMEQEKQDFHERVRQGYLLQAQEQPHQWLVLNGGGAPQELFAEVLKKMKELQWLA